MVDKDLTAGLLAGRPGAAALVILTDVAAVELDHGTPEARPLGRATVGELRSLSFPAGSIMGPTVEAACRFVERTGLSAHIGQLTDVQVMLGARVGTVVEPTGNEATIRGPGAGAAADPRACS